MAEIKFAIEGDGAIAATEELLAMEGMEGSYAVDEEIQREGALAVIATIVGTHIPLVMECKKQLRNRRREKIVALASEREEI